MIQRIILLTLTIVISACGGGGGGGGSNDPTSTPTDPNTVFQLFPASYFTQGYLKTLNYTGTDTAGGVYTATISSQTQAQTTFLGTQAIPIMSQLQLSNTANGASVSNLGTSYFSTSTNDRHYLGYSDSSTSTVSATTSAIPQTAKIGEFGSVGTYTDNAGDIDVQSWRLDDGSNGHAKIVKLSTENDQFGNLSISTTSTTLIDTNGNIITQKIVIYYADENVTLTLNGS